MQPPASTVVTEGHGASVLFIHGTAADRSSWQRLIALVSGSIRATSYDRRGTRAWPIPDDRASPRVEDHADDAADVIRGVGSGPVHLCAVSFGAVIALDLMRRHPSLASSAILFEPAVSGNDRTPSVPRELRQALERWQRDGESEPVAAQFYLRALGEQMWTALPDLMRRDMLARGSQICHDLTANAGYRMRFDELKGITQPVLLLRGGRSRPVFEPGLRALHQSLPRSQRQVIERAGHFTVGDAGPEFASALTAFIGA